VRWAMDMDLFFELFKICEEKQGREFSHEPVKEEKEYDDVMERIQGDY